MRKQFSRGPLLINMVWLLSFSVTRGRLRKLFGLNELNDR